MTGLGLSGERKWRGQDLETLKRKNCRLLNLWTVCSLDRPGQIQSGVELSNAGNCWRISSNCMYMTGASAKGHGGHWSHSCQQWRHEGCSSFPASYFLQWDTTKTFKFRPYGNFGLFFFASSVAYLDELCTISEQIQICICLRSQAGTNKAGPSGTEVQ
jgi:hypothetical protein